MPLNSYENPKTFQNFRHKILKNYLTGFSINWKFNFFQIEGLTSTTISVTINNPTSKMFHIVSKGCLMAKYIWKRNNYGNKLLLVYFNIFFNFCFTRNILEKNVKIWVSYIHHLHILTLHFTHVLIFTFVTHESRQTHSDFQYTIFHSWGSTKLFDYRVIRNFLDKN